MKFKAIVDSLEDVPEALRDYYVEREGKFWLDAEGVEDVSGLKSALSKERMSRQTAETKLSDVSGKLREFREAGFETPSSAADMKAKYEELSQLDPSKEAEKIAEQKYKAREAQLIEKHNLQLRTEQERVGIMTSQLKKVMVDAVATKAIADAKGSVELLLPHIQNVARLKEEGGKFQVEILDGSGNPRIGDSSGNLMSIEQLVGEMKGSTVFGRAFDGAGASGTGAGSTGTERRGGGPPTKTVTRDTMQKGAHDLADIAAGKVTLQE